jgi:hypothetical protein
MGAFVAVRFNVDSLETLGTPPPGRRDTSVLEPFLIDRAAALLDVLLVKLTQVVAEMV